MNKDRNNFFMQEAFKQAKKALQINEVPIGAVVVFENKIIGEGFNQSIKNYFYLYSFLIYFLT